MKKIKKVRHLTGVKLSSYTTHKKGGMTLVSAKTIDKIFALN